MNTQNFIFLSSSLDACKMSSNDRRYFALEGAIAPEVEGSFEDWISNKIIEVKSKKASNKI